MTRPLPTSWSSFESGLSKNRCGDNIAYYPRCLTREIRPWKVKTARSPLGGRQRDRII